MFEIIEVIAPILIKTVCAALHLQVAHLNIEMQTIKTCLAAKEEQIGDLQKKVATLEADADKRDQYPRRPNLRFHGIHRRQMVDGHRYDPAEDGVDPHWCRPPGAKPQTRPKAGRTGSVEQASSHCTLPQRRGAR